MIEDKIPNNWSWSTLKEIVHINSPKPKPQVSDQEMCSFIPMKVISAETGTIVEINFEKYGKIKKGYTGFRENDILFAKITPCMENGKIAIAKNLKNNFGFGTTEFHILRCRVIEMNRILHFYLRQEVFRNLAAKNMTGSVGQKRVPKKYLENSLFPLPPLPEQQRIVNKLESMLPKLKKVKELIQEIKDNLEIQRASILHQVFTGKLTEKWRSKNKLENIEVLLEKINSNIRIQAPYEIPDSWKWVRIKDIAHINPPKFKPDISDEEECSFLPMKSISDELGKIVERYFEKYKKVKKGYTSFQEKDILFAKITPCMENGKIAIAEGLKSNFGFGTTEFHVLRCYIIEMNQLLYLYLRQKKFRDQAAENMTGSVGQKRVPKEYLENSPFPLPPLEEQKEIVRILKNYFQKEEKIKELLKMEKQIDLLEKSILAKAFRGELGTNDPNDEPASELLKRILEEKN